MLLGQLRVYLSLSVTDTDHQSNMVVTLMDKRASTLAPTQLGAKQHSFNPYTDNGGSIMAIAGKDFCVVAGDTRQSEGYQIQTRYKPKVFRL